MAQRDTGWIHLYCEDNQEVLDTCMIAYKIAENAKVHLPVVLGLDGYILSYTAEPVEIPDQNEVDDYLPPYKPKFGLGKPLPYEEWVKRPGGFYGSQNAWLSHHTKMMDTRKVIDEAHKEFNKKFGRNYGGLYEEYRCDDADAVLVAMGTIASTARPVIDQMRSRGRKVGLVKLKTFRPFPDEEFRELATRHKAIGVIDRNVSIGGGGVVYAELRSALYDLDDRPRVLGFHTGLAGKEVTPGHVSHMAEKTLNAAAGGAESAVEWV